MRVYCRTCEIDFYTIQLYDGHPCVVNPGNLPVEREKRRTSVIEMVNAGTGHLDVIRVCDPDCRNEFLLDLGIPCRSSSYPADGHVAVLVSWNEQTYDITWNRNRPAAIPCMLCEHGWRYKIPALVAAAKLRSQAEPSAKVLANRARFLEVRKNK